MQCFKRPNFSAKSKIFKRASWLTVMILLINACATGPNLPIRPSDNQQQRLAQLTTWQLNGRMAFKSDKEKVSAYINWNQEQQRYQVRFNSFVGTSLLTISGSHRHAIMTKGDEQYVSNEPNNLLFNVTGWDIPLLELQHWVKGSITEKGVNAQFDEQGLLRTMTHQTSGWAITYEDYQQVDNVVLPHLINIVKDDKLIKIKIKQWQLENN